MRSSASVLARPSSRRVLAPPAMRAGQRASSCARLSRSSPSTSCSSSSLMTRPSAGGVWLIEKPPSARLFTSTMPVLPRWRRNGFASKRESTACKASVAWPTKGSSLRGLKKRTSRSASLAEDGQCKRPVARVLRAREVLHLGGIEHGRIQCDDRGVAAAARGGEGIDLEDAQRAWHGSGFLACFPARERYHSACPGVARTSLRCQSGEPVELDPVNTGERSRSMRIVRVRFPSFSPSYSPWPRRACMRPMMPATTSSARSSSPAPCASRSSTTWQPASPCSARAR